MAPIQIPDSQSTVQVSVIDTTARMRILPASAFWGPELEGFEKWEACAYSFLITHTDASTGKTTRWVFDLGPPKNWETDLAEPTANMVRNWGADIEVSKYMSEILQEHGVALDSIEGVIWSHLHWDHIGRVSLFPDSVKLVIGPGIKEAFYPGWPANPNSVALERDFQSRDIIELDFTTSPLVIGDFQAIDFFGDGSFYFLSAPGHAPGHVNALARTTAGPGENADPTFILMGADSFHHATQIRPNSDVPLPDNIPGPLPNFAQYTSMCPGHIFDRLHPSSSHRKGHIPAHYAEDITAYHNDPKRTPYFTVSRNPDGSGIAVDLPAANATIRKLQRFDGDDNILLVAAHDQTLFDLVEYYPQQANDWKAKGWKEKGRWRFLGDLYNAVELAHKGN